MADAKVLETIASRADEADKMIDVLRQELVLLHEGLEKASQQEMTLLSDENAKLKEEVLRLKGKLVAAEIKNGKKQVPLPPKQNSAGTAAPAQENKVKLQSEEQQDTRAHSENVPKQDEAKKSQKKEKKEKKKEPPKPAEELPIDVRRLDMRVGKIVGVKKHPDADSLYVEEVDVGEDTTRTIVSGLVRHVPIEQMSDRLAVFMLNLKPAKMRGVLSQGMIMCASTPDKVEILIPPEGVVPGDRVSFKGYEGTPDVLLNPKKKIWEQVAPDLKVDGERVAVYKGVAMEVEGKGRVVAPSLTAVNIK